MENLRLHSEHVERIDSWEEGLYKATAPLLQANVLTSMYLKEIVEEVHRSGETLALGKEVVYFHARPHEGVNENFIACVHTEEPVRYFNQPIRHLFVFGAKSDAEHREILSLTSRYVSAMREDSSLKEEARFIRWFKSRL